MVKGYQNQSVFTKFQQEHNTFQNQSIRNSLGSNLLKSANFNQSQQTLTNADVFNEDINAARGKLSLIEELVNRKDG